MYLDYLTAAALADEIRVELAGARIQSVVQIDPLSVTLELYRRSRWYLTLSADGEREGLSLSEERTRRGAGPPTPLALSLKARGLGARLSEVHQPPFERILEFEIEGADDERLVVELMGRLANIVLVGSDGTVIACARRVTEAMTTARVVLPGRRYEPPPEPLKLAPDELTSQDLEAAMARSPNRPAWRTLVSCLRGVSPLLAREICHRAGVGAAKSGAAAHCPGLREALRDLMALPQTRRWEPTIARDPDDDSLVVAYAPYRLSHLPQTERAPSVAEALRIFETSRWGHDPYRGARAEVSALIGDARKKLQRRIANLRRESQSSEQIERLRLSGDLILAYQTQVTAGQTSLSAPYSPDDPPLEIRLDPKLTPVENATAYYKRHSSAKRAAEKVPRQLQTTGAQLETLDQLETDLRLAQNRSSIDAVHDALSELGHAEQPRRPRAPSGAPLRLLSSDGFVIVVGRNSRQNEIVTFKQARRGDLWLHAREAPGGHVVVRSGGRQVPETTIQEAAGLAAYFSRDRDAAAVPVAVTDVRHVSRLRGAGRGMVRYENEHTVLAAPLSPEALEQEP